MLYYSLGELVDRLTITNLKQWHLEEKMGDDNVSLEEKGKITQQINSLNSFRVKLIESIDEYLEDKNEDSK